MIDCSGVLWMMVPEPKPIEPGADDLDPDDGLARVGDSATRRRWVSGSGRIVGVVTAGSRPGLARLGIVVIRRLA